MNKSDAPEGLVTAERVAEHLSLAEGTIRNLAQRKILPCVKIGKSLRFRLSEVDAWVREQEQQAA